MEGQRFCGSEDVEHFILRDEEENIVEVLKTFHDN
jgi:hypothetical protein